MRDIAAQIYSSFPTRFEVAAVGLAAVTTALLAGVSLGIAWPAVILAPTPLIIARIKSRWWLIALFAYLAYGLGVLWQIEPVVLASLLNNCQAQMGLIAVVLYILSAVMTRYATAGAAGWFAISSVPILAALSVQTMVCPTVQPASRIAIGAVGESNFAQKIVVHDAASNIRVRFAQCAGPPREEHACEADDSSN